MGIMRLVYRTIIVSMLGVRHVLPCRTTLCHTELVAKLGGAGTLFLIGTFPRSYDTRDK